MPDRKWRNIFSHFLMLKQLCYFHKGMNATAVHLNRKNSSAVDHKRPAMSKANVDASKRPVVTSVAGATAAELSPSPSSLFSSLSLEEETAPFDELESLSFVGVSL